MSNRLIDAIKQAHEVLASVQIEHALLGGIAANLYRKRARATQDVDFAITASRADVLRVVDAFREAGWSALARATSHETLRLQHEDLPRVDILIAGTDFEEAAIGRAARLTIDDTELAIVTPEDLIVYKLMPGRAHDYEAVAAVLNAMPAIDEPYVLGWLEQFGMLDRWQQALEEAARVVDD